jgi:hypothetical protein
MRTCLTENRETLISLCRLSTVNKHLVVMFCAQLTSLPSPNTLMPLC